MRAEAEGWLITLDDGVDPTRGSDGVDPAEDGDGVNGPWDDEACRAVLSEEECRRADRLSGPASAVAFMRVRAAVRRVLAHLVAEAPADIRIATAPGGKPVLPDHPELYVSWSASRNVLLVGVCRGAPIGVDVELIRPVESPAKVLRTFCPSVHALGEFHEPETFFSAWTLLEAAVKATGRGMARGARQVQLYRPPGALRCELAGVRDADGAVWSGRTERVALPAGFRPPAGPVSSAGPVASAGPVSSAGALASAVRPSAAAEVMTAVVTRGSAAAFRLRAWRLPDAPPPLVSTLPVTQRPSVFEEL
ncbi:4'-phosphopantetheinyl transferase family protein [Streptomyces sp. NPDC002643]